MRRRGRNSGLWFEEEINIEAKTMREVRPRIVIRHDVLSTKRQQRRAPFLQLRIDRRLEFFVVRFVKRSIRRVQSGKRLRNMLSNRLRDDRVDSKVRIAERMHVTCGACGVRRHVHQANTLRCLNPPWFADFDLGISRVLEKWRQPAELELCAAVDQYISVTH